MAAVDDIVLLCEAVDNYGDVGFAWRLACRFKAIRPSLRIRFVVNDVARLALIASNIEPALALQHTNIALVLDSTDSAVCYREFREHFPRLILQLLECRRPKWLEELLFKSPSTHPVVQLINIDYLTAQSYATTFHKLLSLTRSKRVKKLNFMPGFTKGTGGLILDTPYSECGTKGSSPFTILLFSYYREDALLLARSFIALSKLEGIGGVRLLIAGDSANKAFYTKCKALLVNEGIEISLLPFMPLRCWDKTIRGVDLALVRGEDSFTRALLYGVPTIWQAYRQDEDYQLVKVEAFLECIKPYFTPLSYNALRAFYLGYNTTTSSFANMPSALVALMQEYSTLKLGFRAFSKLLYSNGDFGEGLLDFIDSLDLDTELVI